MHEARSPCNLTNMPTVMHSRFLSFAACILAGSASGLTQQTVTLSEPPPVKIQELFKQADLVAVVRILSGDTEQYPVSLYKAEVVQSFKGIDVGTKIFFGPYVSYRLGSEYLVFLQHSKKAIEPKEQSGIPGMNYGRVNSFYTIMYQGNSAMLIRYTCVFDGKDVSQQCDNGIKLNPEQIVLPNTLKTFPTDSGNASGEEDRWVRKSILISFLRSLSK
ncbi:MAG: hypothetical protein WBG29_15965 [Candidatus Acidiferrales bacterium]